MTYPSLHYMCCNAGSLLFLLLLFLLALQVWDLPRSLTSNHFLSWSANVDIPCTPIPGFEDVLVVLKTGATEALDKVPIHFDTTLRCVPHFVVFSDLEEYIIGHHVHNVLEDIDEDMKRTNPDFELYNRLQAYGRAGLQESELQEWSSAANTAGGILDNPAWKLDKWKFLPLIEKSFRYRPEAKWYVFMEADTYMLWPSLMKWLSHVDPTKPHYFGSQTQLGDVVFAHGGSGFIVSNPAMQMVAEHRATHTAYYQEYTESQWAGDSILGKAMTNAGISMTWSWPHLQGGRLSEMDFESVEHDMKMWCYEAVSYHHQTPEEMTELWMFEQDWNSQNHSLLRHKDVFQKFVIPRLAPERKDWDNLADMPVTYRDTQHGFPSFETCRKACELRQDCVQFSYSGSNCHISSVIRLGHETKALGHKEIQSGWIMDRVDAYVQSLEDCGSEQWILP